MLHRNDFDRSIRVWRRGQAGSIDKTGAGSGDRQRRPS